MFDSKRFKLNQAVVNLPSYSIHFSLNCFWLLLIFARVEEGFVRLLSVTNGAFIDGTGVALVQNRLNIVRCRGGWSDRVLRTMTRGTENSTMAFGVFE